MGRKRKAPELVAVPLLKRKFDIDRVHRHHTEASTKTPAPPANNQKAEPKA